MKPSQHFLHCPRCGARQPAPPTGGVFTCAACSFTLYFNAAIATAAFIAAEDGRVLLIRRAKDPARGKLAPPGGFVDIGETAEQAIRREIREEVGLEEISDLTFLCSQPNSYHYKGVVYPVLDFFFTARSAAKEQVRALDDVESFLWLDLFAIQPAELAFPSMRAALEMLQNLQRKQA